MDGRYLGLSPISILSVDILGKTAWLVLGPSRA